MNRCNMGKMWLNWKGWHKMAEQSATLILLTWCFSYVLESKRIFIFTFKSQILMLQMSHMFKSALLTFFIITSLWSCYFSLEHCFTETFTNYLHFCSPAENVSTLAHCCPPWGVEFGEDCGNNRKTFSCFSLEYEQQRCFKITRKVLDSCFTGCTVK